MLISYHAYRMQIIQHAKVHTMRFSPATNFDQLDLDLLHLDQNTILIHVTLISVVMVKTVLATMSAHERAMTVSLDLVVMVSPVVISSNVPSQTTTVSTQIVPTLMAVLSKLVLLVMMEHQAVLTSMNVQMVMLIHVKLQRIVLVSVRRLPMVTYTLAHLVTPIIGMKMNGMLQRLDV